MSRNRRERELLRIAKENMNRLRRIHHKKPAISVDKLEKDWRQNLKFMDNISSYPEDWYLREGNFQSQSNPNLNNTNRSSVKSSPRKPTKNSNSNSNSQSKRDTTTTDTDNKETTDYENEFDTTE